MKKFLILALLALLLVSCADPRLQADADMTRMQAEQEAADAEQRRAQDAEQFALEQSQREAVSNQWVSSQVNLMFWAMNALTLFVVCALLALAIGTAISFVGIGWAVARGAWVRSNLIGLDAETGQYPLMIQRVANGQYTLTDPNTGQVLQLEMRRQADRQMVAAAFASRLNAVTARQARLAGKHAEGVAMIGTNPVVVMDGGSDGEQ